MAQIYIRWLLLAGVSIMFSGVFGQSPAQDKSDVLAGYKWQKRILLVFAPDINNPEGAAQLKLLKQTQQDLTGRDLVLISVRGDEIESKIPGDITADDLRQQFQVKSTVFTLILIGKDGGEKYRTTHLTKPAVIFNIIDAMPMRQSEMKRRVRD